MSISHKYLSLPMCRVSEVKRLSKYFVIILFGAIYATIKKKTPCITDAVGIRISFLLQVPALPA